MDAGYIENNIRYHESSTPLWANYLRQHCKTAMGLKWLWLEICNTGEVIINTALWCSFPQARDIDNTFVFISFKHLQTSVAGVLFS